MAQQKKNTGNKILSVVWYNVLPARYGGQKAVAFFNEAMAAFAPLVCLCSTSNQPGNASYAVDNSLPVSKTQFLNPWVWRMICSKAKKEKVTHLILEFPYHGIAGIICKKLLGVCLVVNTHNIEFLRFKEMGKWWWRLLFFYEKWLLKNADAVFFKTEKDRQSALGYFKIMPAKTAVVPYGAIELTQLTVTQSASSLRQRYGITKDEKLLLFAATLDYQPNADAVMAITKRLVPLLNQKGVQYKLLICGRNKIKGFQYLHALSSNRLIFTGEVDDMDAHFALADLFICPVMSGGGVQTKIVDALSHHLNVVCFKSKAAAISEAGNKLFLVEDGNWEAFASAIITALNVGGFTPPGFFKTYNWRSIAATALQKLTSV